MTTPESPREAAVQFLHLVTSGKIHEAYQIYIDMKGKHHNTFFPAGFSALREAMQENHTQYPKKQLKIIHVLHDGDLVAVHSHLTLKAGEPGMITVHLFRFKNGKIVEMWDCGQALQHTSPNKEGAF
ncbi:MAG: nuclear transport factor 2 family protein [Candidatus Woesearchaeota archaeon]|nr:nuclear transport factor 2 family protein [Candidatus Woesearchaeota archaeon]